MLKVLEDAIGGQGVEELDAVKLDTRKGTRRMLAAALWAEVA